MDVQDLITITGQLKDSVFHFSWWLKRRTQLAETDPELLAIGLDSYDQSEIRQTIERTKGELDSLMLIVGGWNV